MKIKGIMELFESKHGELNIFDKQGNKYTKIHFNEIVEVELTEIGVIHWNQKRENKTEKYKKTQLHVLFKTFEDIIVDGVDKPFELDILLVGDPFLETVDNPGDLENLY